MTDIVEILRDQHNHDEYWLRQMCLTAAAEIEILRKKNDELQKDAIWIIRKARDAAGAWGL